MIIEQGAKTLGLVLLGLSLVASSAEARSDRHHGGGNQGGGHHSHHDRGHKDRGHHGAKHGRKDRHGGGKHREEHERGDRRDVRVDRTVRIVHGRPVVRVDRPAPIGLRGSAPVSFGGSGGDCRTSRRVDRLPSGFRRITTTRVCIVP